MTVQEAAEIAKVAIPTIYNWFATGKLDGIAKKRFGRIVIDAKKFKEFVAANG